MRTGTVIALLSLLACVFALGCATAASQDAPTTPPPTPAQPDEDDVAPGPEAQPEAAPDEAMPMNVDIRFPLLDGWEPADAPEQNWMAFTHTETNSLLAFTVWPARLGGTPREYIDGLWTEAVNAALQEEDTEVNMPITMDDMEGRDISMFTMVEIRSTPQGDLRVSRVFVGLESNLPQLNILIVGIWPEALDAPMLQALEQLGRGIVINVIDGMAPPPPELDSGSPPPLGNETLPQPETL